MPKKRFTSKYSKPQSTVHPSLGSASTASVSSSRNDAAPSVNDLISNLRKSHISTPDDQRNASANSRTVTPTLPPSIRSLLSLPETPPPRPRGRDRRRYDENGRRLPAGPAAPQSWLEAEPVKAEAIKPRSTTRTYPITIKHLPGIASPHHGSLQDICLRQMAKQWSFIQQYEKFNLAHLPTKMRMLLLSYIAVYGPEDGVGHGGLKDLLVPPPYEEDVEQETNIQRNDNFFRLDVSCSIGRSVTFKQLTELVSVAPEDDADTWEQAISMPLSPAIPHLTHLSLSHPPSHVSWPKLLAFAQHVPTITHLSLAHWPAPNLTPNSNTAVMSTQSGMDVQYGASNYYSHYDNDFSQASEILKRLANSLYSLEWLDISGSMSWIKALTHRSREGTGLDWTNQWKSLEIIVAKSSLDIKKDEGNPETRNRDINLFKQDHHTCLQMKWLIQHIRKQRGRKAWIDIQLDDYNKWDSLWTGPEPLPWSGIRPEATALFWLDFGGNESLPQTLPDNNNW